MKVVNDSDKPFEFFFDGKPHVMAPGEICDYRADIAQHAMRKSLEIDDEALPIRRQVIPLEEAKQSGRLKDYANLVCPFVKLDECSHAPFVRAEDLTRHVAEFHRDPELEKSAEGTTDSDDLPKVEPTVFVCQKCGNYTGSRLDVETHERYCKKTKRAS